jgi:hypothetical protein
MTKEMTNAILSVVAVLAILIGIYVLYTVVKFLALYVFLPLLVVGGLGYFLWKVLK